MVLNGEWQNSLFIYSHALVDWKRKHVWSSMVSGKIHFLFISMHLSIGNGNMYGPQWWWQNDFLSIQERNDVGNFYRKQIVV